MVVWLSVAWMTSAWAGVDTDDTFQPVVDTYETGYPPCDSGDVFPWCSPDDTDTDTDGQDSDTDTDTDTDPKDTGSPFVPDGDSGMEPMDSVPTSDTDDGSFVFDTAIPYDYDGLTASQIKGDPGGCTCGTSGLPGVGLLAMMSLVGIVRRRRL